MEYKPLATGEGEVEADGHFKTGGRGLLTKSAWIAGLLVVIYFAYHLTQGSTDPSQSHERPVTWTSRPSVEPAKPVSGEGKSPAYGRYINFYERKRLPAHLAYPDHKSSRQGKIWLIGDVHGMLEPLKELVRKIDFDPSLDMIIIVGDLVAKGPQSLEVIHWARTHGYYSVRGNHDDKLVKWREWLTSPEGSHALGMDDEPTGQLAPPEHLGKWRSEHRKLAQKIDQADYEWLLHAPVIMHLKEYMTYVVHAGLLPPTYHLRRRDEPDEAAQVGSHDDDLDSLQGPISLDQIHASLTSSLSTTESLLVVNSDPYIPMNMRSIYKGQATKKADLGRHWGKEWRDAMRECKSSAPHKCIMGQIIYGHAAGRGLDLRKWTKGLDSACVYGGQLTALALPHPDDIAASINDEQIMRHNLVQVECEAATTEVD